MWLNSNFKDCAFNTIIIHILMLVLIEVLPGVTVHDVLMRGYAPTPTLSYALAP